MKRYTGNLVLELEDVNTGVVETVSETNMVTNAVNDILGVNPMGVMYKAGGQYDDSLTWNEELLPICPNMIGGILLFPSSITEQADNLYLPSTNLPVAYASNDVNATANTKRGSMNLTESMKLSDGFKFVWEFTPSQGNGTIAAVGLTSKHGGANAYGSEVAVDSTLLQIKKVSLDDGDGFINDLFRCVTVDFENAKLYALCYASNTVTIKRYRIPVFDIGLNEKLDDSTLTLEDTTVLQCSPVQHLPFLRKLYAVWNLYGWRRWVLVWICQSGKFLRQRNGALDQDQEERLYIYGRSVDAFQCNADDDGKLQGGIELSVRKQKCCGKEWISVCAVL